jgi:hypothetical protein
MMKKRERQGINSYFHRTGLLFFFRWCEAAKGQHGHRNTKDVISLLNVIFSNNDACIRSKFIYKI